MKKMRIALASMLVAAGITATAGAANFTNCADRLKDVRLYNKTGKVVLSKEFTGDYNHVKLCDDQVIMYDGKTCSIFMKNGVQKFKGRMDNNIQEIFPVGGVNQYIVLSANGMEKIRLVK